MKITCTTCQREFEIPVTDAQLKEWTGGRLIQKAMPELTPGQRELLMSQTCGECFDKMFEDD